MHCCDAVVLCAQCWFYCNVHYGQKVWCVHSVGVRAVCTAVTMWGCVHSVGVTVMCTAVTLCVVRAQCWCYSNTHRCDTVCGVCTELVLPYCALL